MRHTFNNDQGLVIAYGYDRPLRGYFLTVYDPSKEWKEDNTDEQNEAAERVDPSGSGIIAEYATNSLLGSNVVSRGRILELLEKYDCPHEYNMMMIAGDMQI